MKSLVRKTLGVKDQKVVSVKKGSDKVTIIMERKLRRKLYVPLLDWISNKG